MARTRLKDAKAVSLDTPEFLTLAKKPANQTGFKVIRSEEGQEELVSLNRNPRIRSKPAKRSDSNLMSITFPMGVTREEAEEAVAAFDLGEDYELVESDEGSFRLNRRGDHEGVETTAIEMHSGMVAYIASSAFETAKRSDVDPKEAGVTVVRMDFSESEFSNAEDVKGWLTDRDIDFQQGGVEVVEGGIIVTRHDTNKKTRSMEISAGVTAHLVRSEADDIPTRIYRSVMESAYGNWGWGMYSFDQAMADPEFTSKSWDAIYTLQDVLENIVIYSGLTLEERKALIHNACESYANYMSGLIDSLPRGVIEQARSDRNQTSEETDMAGKKTPAAKPAAAKRSDAEDQSKDPNAQAAAGDEGKEGDDESGEAETLTRDDVVSIATEAATAAVTAVLAKRDEEAGAADDEGEEETSKRSDDESEDPTAKALADIASGMKGIQTELKQMRSDVDALADGETITRSDDEEGTEETEEDLEASKRSDSPFAGMFASSLGVK